MYNKIVVFGTALLLVCSSLVVSATLNDTLSVGSAVLNPDSSVCLPVSIGNVSGIVSSVFFELHYRHDIISIESISANNTLPLVSITSRIDNNAGYAIIELNNTSITYQELTGIIDVLFHSLQSGSSDMLLENISLQNDTALFRPANVINGSIRVNNPPEMETIDNRTVNAGERLFFYIEARDYDDELLTYTATGLPSGAQFNETARFFDWTPRVEDEGTYMVTFSVSDGFAVYSEVIAIIVNAGSIDEPPVMSSIGNRTCNEGEVISILIYATDPNNDTITYSSPSLPDDSTLDSTSGLFTWNTDYEEAGDYRVEFIATANGLTDSEIITITVVNVNRNPVLAPIGNKTVNEGQQISFTVSGADPDNDILTYSASSVPEGAIFNSNTGEFTWMPGYDKAGSYQITFTVSDGELADSETITITVNNVNRPPVLESIPYTLVNEMESLTIILSGTDPDNDKVSYSKNVTFGTLVSNVFTWTPGYSDSGLHYVKLSLSDGSLEDHQIAVIAVGNTNVPPELDPIGNKVVNENETISFNVSASDFDMDALTYSVAGLPQGASFNNLSGLFVWKPTYEQAGSYSVVFRVSDGLSIDMEIVVITVLNTNRPPVLTAIGNRTTNEGQQIKFTINGSDPDKDTFTYASSTLPGGASLNAGTGEFSWTPGYDEAGKYYVTFMVSDGELSDSETITITVNNVNRAPGLTTIGNKTVSEGQQLKFTVIGSDPDSDALVYSVSPLPSGAAFNNITGEFSWTPEYGDAGNYSVTFTVADGSLKDSETIRISVTHINREPTLLVIGQKSVKENESLTFTLSATDPDRDVLRYYAADLPRGCTLDISSGHVTWTPTYDQAGTYKIRFGVTDGLAFDEETVSIEVINVNRPPVLNVANSLTIQENTTLRLMLNASDPDGDILIYKMNAPFGFLDEGLFTWTPSSDQSGIYNIFFTVSDTEYETSAELMINVIDANCAPQLDPISDSLVNELQTIVIELKATDIDGDVLFFSKNVSYGILSGNMFTWTPDYNASGFHYILFTVSDGLISDSKIAKIAVGNTNIPPVLEYIGPRQIHENETLAFYLKASDVDNDTLRYSATGLPEGATLDTETGLFKWTPTYDQTGIHNIVFRVSDWIYTDLETVKIEVINVNRPPAFDPSFGAMTIHHVNETETLRINLNATDPDGDTLIFSVMGPRGYLAGKTFIWTPGNYDGGTYEIEFIVTDGELSDTAIVYVEVHETNIPPEIEYIGPKHVYENETLRFFVNATDGDGDKLTYSVIGSLPGGAFFNKSDNLFTWTPGYNQSGTYSIEFEVSDGKANASGTVSIVVYKVNKPTTPQDNPGFPSSSGGSGGSASSGSEAYGNIRLQDYSIKYLLSGKEVSFDFPNANNDIQYLKMVPSKTAGQIKAIVEILNDTSSMVNSAPPGLVYRNLNIWVGDEKFSSGNYISSANIGFRVGKKWISEQEVDPDSIRLLRYSNGKWDELTTSRVGNDVNFYYYRTKSPGFSQFSIVSIGKPSASNEDKHSEALTDISQRIYYAQDSQHASNITTAVPDPKKYQPVNTGIFLAGIGIILIIGLLLGYRSRDESAVLREYNAAIKSIIRNLQKEK